MSSPARLASRILVLQHVEVEGPGLIGATLANMGMPFDVLRIDRGASVPADARDYAGLVVMGGPMGVYEAGRYPHLAGELRLIECFLRDDRPILGVCLGSQLLAAALGARVHASGRPEVGWIPVRLEPGASRDTVLGQAPRDFTPLQWHGDVFDLPAGAVRLARSELTETQAFRFGASAWGLLFHLEASAEQVRTMATVFEDDLRSAGVDRAALVAEAGERTRDLAILARRAFSAWADLVGPGTT